MYEICKEEIECCKSFKFLNKIFQESLTVRSRIDKAVGTIFRHSGVLYIHSRHRVFWRTK